MELQQEATLAKEQERSQSQKAKGKRKAAEADLDDDDEMDIDMSFDAVERSEGGSDDGSDVEMNEENADGQEIQPMPVSGGIQDLRDRLHARMAALRRGARGGGDYGEAGSRDELIEERRRQRATLRENRRKETREKIKREADAKGKKGKEQNRNAAPTTKVCPTIFDFSKISLNVYYFYFYKSNNSSSPTTPPPLAPITTLTLQLPTSPSPSSPTLLPRLASKNISRPLPILPKRSHNSLHGRKSWHRCQRINGRIGKRGRNGRRPKLGWKVSRCTMMRVG